jgi:hypothetical protein
VASLRDKLLLALRTRLAGLTGWTVDLRAATNSGPASGVWAVVTPADEDSQLLFAEPPTYSCKLRVMVWIAVNVEDADQALDTDPTNPTVANPYRYLDRMLTLAQQKVHDGAWSVAGWDGDVAITGTDVANPEDETRIATTLHLLFSYRHSGADASGEG